MRLCAACLVAWMIPASVGAQRRSSIVEETWTAPNPGVWHLHRRSTEPPVSVHAVIADLRAPGVRVIATPQDERWGTVADFARAHRAAVAINGGFWGLWQRPSGIAAGGGSSWSTSAPDPDFGHFGVRTSGDAVVHPAGEGERERDVAQLTDAVSGRPILVIDGAVATDVLDAFEGARQRHPRTAIGVSRDRRRVFVVVVDGRQAHSRGLSLYDLAQVFVSLGADRAINLDGGGSSTLFVANEGGLVSSPSRGRWVRMLGLTSDESARVRTNEGEPEVFVRGVEREVLNHVAILAPDPPVLAPTAPTAVQAPAPLPIAVAGFAPPPTAPLRVGRAREWVVPIGVSAVLTMLIALTIARRRRSSQMQRDCDSAGAALQKQR